MISSIILENMNTKSKLTLSNDGDGKFILDNAGVDWGTVESSIYTYKSSKKIGSQVSGVEVESREIMIVGWIYGSKKQIEDSQFWLGRFILPSDSIKIHVKDYYIIGTPLNVPKFGKNVKQNNDYMCRFVIELYCPEPEFIRSMPNVTEYTKLYPGFRFPFHFVENGSGVTFGTIELSTVQLIENTGVHAVGGIIKFRCVGESLRNPKIFNIYNPSEFILIDKTLSYGEEIVINTNYTKESIIG